MRKPALSRRLLFTIFTISGFSGLIYESIWSHYLKLFLGHAAYAQTLVLAIFMGGMALGSWLVARNTGRIKNLLIGYAVVELITGAIALGFHSFYGGAVALAFDSAIPSMDGAITITLFKWSLAALLILPQSILLGTTFPLISGGVIRRFPERSGETLAMLYFTNCLGAALGVLASGFLLIGLVGLPGTVMAAGILNVLLALFVWLMARDQEVTRASGDVSAGSAISPMLRFILLVAFLAGLASFVYEIAWIRMLSLVLGSSTHAFELMLSAFILGLAFGGLWVRRRIDSYANPLRTLAVMFALMAVLGGLTLPAYGLSFDIMADAIQMFDSTEQGYAGFNVVSHAIAAGMMIPTTIIAGMTLPLMTHFLLRGGAGEQAIGKVYAANTVGAIVGVLLAIHLLLPHIGTKGAVISAALTQGAVAFLLLWREPRAHRTTLSITTLAASAVAVLAIAFLVRLDPMKMASGVFRHGVASLPTDTQVTFMRDGKTATISLSRQGDNVIIATNGKPDAAINMSGGEAQADEITMTMAAALPLVMHPNPRRVANIGIGSGLTSHVVLTSPLVDKLDSIEIEPAIVEAARLGFGPRVRNLFEDSRSHIHYEDAKTFFATAKQPYDVIISEPSNPWVSGVASLFSSEFYVQVKRYLAKDGMLVQWVQTYETDMTIVASIVKALSPHFADYQIFNTDDSDILIVATVNGPVPAIRAEVLQGRLAEELRIVSVESIADIEVRRIGSKRFLDAIFASYPAPANSDYFPFVDLNAPRMRFLGRRALTLSELNRDSVPVLEILGEAGPQQLPAPSSQKNFLVREDRVQEAMRIRAALQKRSPAGLGLALAKDVLTVHTEGSQCGDSATREIWLQAVHALSRRTASQLPAGEQPPLWAAIRASACFPHLDHRQRRWVDFLEAMGQRNPAALLDHGRELLQTRSAQTVEMLSDLVLAVSAAQLARGDAQGAAQLLDAHRPLIAGQRDMHLGFRVVDTLARQGGAEAP